MGEAGWDSGKPGSFRGRMGFGLLRQHTKRVSESGSTAVKVSVLLGSLFSVPGFSPLVSQENQDLAPREEYSRYLSKNEVLSADSCEVKQRPEGL